MLETLDHILSVLVVHRPFYILICISNLPTQHTTFIVFHQLLLIRAVHTKIDLSWIDLGSISVRFEKVFTLI